MTAASTDKTDLTVLTLTTSQACERLGCSRQTVYRLWKAGKLERVRFHGHTRITVDSLNALIKEIMAERMLPPS